MGSKRKPLPDRIPCNIIIRNFTLFLGQFATAPKAVNGRFRSSGNQHELSMGLLLISASSKMHAKIFFLNI